VQQTLSISQSERVTAAASALAGVKGTLTAELLTFAIRAGQDTITESYILAAGITDSRVPLDAEQVEQILDLDCTQVNEVDALDTLELQPMLEEQVASFSGEVQTRTAQFTIDQGDLVESQLKDHKAKYDAEARRLDKAKEEVNARERRADGLPERLKLRKEAQRSARRADDLYSDYREERVRLRQKADEYIEMLEDALQGTERRESIFTIRWAVRS